MVNILYIQYAIHMFNTPQKKHEANMNDNIQPPAAGDQINVNDQGAAGGGDANVRGGQEENQVNEGHIARVSVRAPPFWKENPALWFRQLESQFYTNNIRVSETKYHMAVSALDTSVINQVSDIIMNPPAENKYETLKAKLQERFADSEELRFRKLLSNLDLGDKKPSQLWREMRELAGQNVNEPILKTLWLQRLPPQVRAFVSTDPGDMARLLTISDQIHEIVDNRNIHVVENKTSRQLTETSIEDKVSAALTNVLEKFSTQMSMWTQQVSSLNSVDRAQQNPTTQTQHHRGRSNSRGNQPRAASQTRDQTPHRICWYHHRFGNNATRCTKPCAYIPTQSENQ